MIIPILHHEKQVQLKDLTRFNASKSALVKGSANPINAVKIKPGADASEINVYSATPANWFLDFAFTEYKFDVDSTNSKIVFEFAGVEYSTDAAAATYTLANLLTEIKDKIQVIAGAGITSITLDDRNRVVIVAASSLKILLRANDNLLRHLGFKKNGQTTSDPVEYGLRKVTLKVESSSENETIVVYLEVYTADGDALFSEDSDLVGYENDIMKWLPNGRGSFLDLHRKSQKLILDWLDRQGYRDDQGDKITKFQFIDNSDVRTWSAYKALNLFFAGNQNSTDDVFKDKSKYYKGLEVEARDRAVLTLDLDKDGEKDDQLGPDIRSGRLFFR